MGRKTPADRHAPLGRIIVKTIRLIPVLILMLSLSCCGGGSKEPAVVTVMTHDSFSIGENVVAEFEKANGVKLKFLKSGDAGAALNQAILSKDNPMADVFFGVDNTFLTRALKADIFLPHDSPLLSKIDPALVLDPEKRLLPVDYGDVCLNYDKAGSRKRDWPRPRISKPWPNRNTKTLPWSKIRPRVRPVWRSCWPR
jgi:thiamine transport system substrate-binding protein